MIKLILFSSLFLVIVIEISSCKPKNLPPISDYSGEFIFTIFTQVYTSGYPMIYDTLIYEGNIRKYMRDDDFKDMAATFIHNPDISITIEFMPPTCITPELLETGKFVSRQEGHFHQSGEFLTKDSVKFEISDGSLGSNETYKVIGIRK